MMFKTHLAFGFLIGLLGIMFFRPSNQILFMTAVIIASALPDIDHPNSKLGKKVKFIGWMFEHRGFFHSIFAIAIFSIVAFIAFKAQIYAYAVLIGYTSHLLIDVLTVQGIMPLHPFTKLRLRGFVKTNTAAEFLIFVGLLIMDVVLLLRI